MLDSKHFRQDIDVTAKRLATRGFVLDAQAIADLEQRRKAAQTRTQELQTERNTKSKNIGKAKAQGQDIKQLLDEVAHLGDELKAAETELQDIQIQLDEMLLGVPNIPHESVPVGKDETQNVEVRKWGEPRQFDFEVKDHVDLGDFWDHHTSIACVIVRDGANTL